MTLSIVLKLTLTWILGLVRLREHTYRGQLEDGVTMLEHNIFTFGLGLVPRLRLCLRVSLVWVTARLPL